MSTTPTPEQAAVAARLKLLEPVQRAVSALDALNPAVLLTVPGTMRDVRAARAALVLLLTRQLEAAPRDAGVTPEEPS